MVSLFFLFVISCSNPRNSRNTNNENNDVNTGNGTNNVTVLCRCKEGFTSWYGPDQASAEDRARKNCASINGSARDCKIIN